MLRSLLIAAALFSALLLTFPSAFAKGRVDQSAIGPWWGDFNLVLGLKQSFRPDATVLTGVTVGLDRMGQESRTNVTLTVRSGGLNGPVIATSSRSIDDYAPGQPFDFDAGTHLEHFEFATPAATVPGQLYVIQLDSDNGGLGWASPGYDAYPDGNAYWGTQAITAWDLMFQTCGDGDGRVCKQKTQFVSPSGEIRPHLPHLPHPHRNDPTCIDFDQDACSDY
jgi:hypothetical protein